MKNILITGGSGLLGSALRITLEKDHKVYLFEGDIAKVDDIEKYNSKKMDWIVHTAAFTDVNFCEKDRTSCHRVNVYGTKNIRELSKKTGAKLIYISTASVFSGKEGNYKENDLPYPTNFYNLTKLLGEQLVSECENSLILRINLIGIHPNGSRGQNFFEWLYDTIKDNQDIKLFSDVIINPLSNWTIAEYIKKIIESNLKGKVLHLGSKNNLSKADIGRLVIDELKNYKGKITISSIDDLSGPARPKQLWLNTDLSKNLLGEMPTLESEVKKILNHL